MEKECVSYEQAVALKEIGFDGDALKVYSTKWTKLIDEEYAVRYDVDYVLAPLKQQAFRWFREKYDLHCRIEIGSSTYCYYAYIDQLLTIDDCIQHSIGHVYNAYEEAENACINKLIELAKQ